MEKGMENEKNNVEIVIALYRSRYRTREKSYAYQWQ